MPISVNTAKEVLHSRDLDYSPNLARMRDDFRRDGYVVITQVVGEAELAGLRADTAEVIVDGAGRRDDPDYFFATNADGEFLHRVQYIFPKGRRHSLLHLVGHPQLLAMVQTILGRDFLCAGEALVFKAAGNGRVVPVHADCDPESVRPSHLFFNIDVYLDDSDEDNGCLCAARGSHRSGESSAAISAQGFAYPGLHPIPVRAGDVIIHDTRLVHGSHPSRSQRQRRTLYYEFHDRHEVLTEGYPPGCPFPLSWAENRQRILHYAIAERAQQPWARGETPFTYAPATPAAAEGVGIDFRPRLSYSQYV